DLIPWRFRGQLQWRRGISCREQEDQRSGIIWRRGRPAAAAARRRRSGHPGRSPRSAAPAAPSRSGSDRSMMIFFFFVRSES
ncbi:Os09g0400700, partial [Oryza sativa Japonica Group]